MKEAPLIRRILSLCCKPLTAQGGYTTAAHGRDSALGPCWVEQAAQAADRHASLLAAPALGTTASGTEDREQRDALGPLRGAVRGLPGFRHPGVGGLTPGGVSCRSQALLMILPEGSSGGGKPSSPQGALHQGIQELSSTEFWSSLPFQAHRIVFKSSLCHTWIR